MMSMTTMLMILTVVISFTSFNNPQRLNKLMFNPVAIRQGNQWYRLVTSGFVHAGWLHLGFNMFTFYFFGSLVEQVFEQLQGPQGKYYYLAFYLGAIIISDLPSLVKHKGNYYYNSLGASGGVAAVVFSSILFFPTNPIYLFAVLPIPGFILGILYLIYSYTKGKEMADNVNHDAHIYGALYGLAASVLMEPRVVISFFQEVWDWIRL